MGYRTCPSSELTTGRLDFVRCDLRALARPCRVKWFPRALVYLCLPLPYPVLLDYPDQVRIQAYMVLG